MSAPVEPTHYTFKVTGKVWQIVGELRSQLLASGSWVQATRDDQAAHLLLADRGRVNFARDMIGHRAPSTPARFASFADSSKATLCMCNVYRGCNELTNKSALVKTMRQYAKERGLTAEQMEYLPSTFVLRPGDTTDERTMFLAEFNRTEEAQNAAAAAAASSASSAAASSSSVAPAAVPRSKNVWIAKANRGAKGSAIFVSDDAQKLIAYIDAQRGNDALASAEAESGSSEATDAQVASSASPPPSGTASAAVTALDLPAAAAASSPAAAPASGSISARAPPLRSRLGSAASLRSNSGALTSRAPVKGLAAAASNSWVLQRYLSSPFLLSGRKFDIRCWALLDSSYRMYLYRNAVARTSSTAFNLENLADQFVHLTNHCIQTAHPDYATKEEGNEIFLPELQAYLESLPSPPPLGSPLPPHPLCVICHLLPQLRHVVRETLGSVRSRMQSAGDYHSFQLFGYDLMLDSAFHVRLLEINATPASAQKTLSGIVAHMKERAIDAVYPDRAGSAAEQVKTPASQQRDATAAGSIFNPAAILAQPCHCSSMLSSLQLSRREYLSPPAQRRINLFDLIG